MGKPKIKKKPKLVHIDWISEDYDWPWFWLVTECKDGWVYLRGADYPDGSHAHDGDYFWAHKDDMRGMTKYKKD